MASSYSDSVGVRTQDPQLRRPTLEYNVTRYILIHYEMKTKYNLFVFSWYNRLFVNNSANMESWLTVFTHYNHR